MTTAVRKPAPAKESAQVLTATAVAPAVAVRAVPREARVGLAAPLVPAMARVAVRTADRAAMAEAPKRVRLTSTSFGETSIASLAACSAAGVAMAAAAVATKAATVATAGAAEVAAASSRTCEAPVWAPASSERWPS